jgi:hypothetical protein
VLTVAEPSVRYSTDDEQTIEGLTDRLLELAHLIERQHNDRLLAIMDRYLPQWRVYRQVLNAAPLAHEAWTY